MGEKEEKERILNQAAGAVPLLQLSYAIPYSTTPVLARPSWSQTPRVEISMQKHLASIGPREHYASTRVYPPDLD